MIKYNSYFNNKIVNTTSNKVYRIDNNNYLGGGKDGEVFSVNGEVAVKLYIDTISPSALDKIKYLITLGNKGYFHESIIHPIELVEFESKTIGFSMRFIPDAKPINQFKWNSDIPIQQQELFDRTIANILYNLCDALKSLHKNRIYLGDLKPANILVSGFQPYIIDFDSCSLPNYPGESFTIEYLDPLIRDGIPDAIGKNSEFSAKSDWWAVGVMSFLLFIGISPWGGINRKYLRDPYATRSFNYSSIHIDPLVRLPKSVRTKDWLTKRPRLLEFYKGIFSTNGEARKPISRTLELYYSKESFHTSDRKELQLLINKLIIDKSTKVFLEGYIDHLIQKSLNKYEKYKTVKNQLLDFMYYD